MLWSGPKLNMTLWLIGIQHATMATFPYNSLATLLALEWKLFHHFKIIYIFISLFILGKKGQEPATLFRGKGQKAPGQKENTKPWPTMAGQHHPECCGQDPHKKSGCWVTRVTIGSPATPTKLTQKSWSLATSKRWAPPEIAADVWLVSKPLL